MAVEIGHVVGDKYVLVRRIGRGSMGEVWMATHRALGERVAIKFLTPDEAMAKERDTLQRRFLFEARVAARLSRKTAHVVSVTDYGVEGGVAYLVMELLAGADLEAILRRSGPVPLARVNTIVAHACLGLSVAHAQGVLHRDLKTANLFITRDERGNSWLKILDFGLARLMHSPRLTARGLVVGSDAFMSPEQAINHPALDARCDLWALSVVAFEALTGALPFEPDPPAEWLRLVRSGEVPSVRRWRPELPTAVDTFFRRAFAAHIDYRFPTAASLSSAFDAAVRSTEARADMKETPGSRAPTPVVCDPRSARRLATEALRRGTPHRVVTALALLVVAGLAMIVVTVTRAHFAAVRSRSALVVAAPLTSPPLSPRLVHTQEAETPEPPSSTAPFPTPARSAAPALAVAKKARNGPAASSSSDGGSAADASPQVVSSPGASARPNAVASDTSSTEDLGYGDRK
jgi:serine/threonine protein kinase